MVTATATTRDTTDDLAFLSKVVLFRNIPEHDMLFLARIVKHARYGAGEIIFEKNSDSSDFIIVRQGTVSVFIPAEDGQRIELTTLGPGSYFGEMAIFDDYPRSAGVMCETDVRTFHIDKDAFRSFVRFHPGTLFQMCTVFSHRIRNTNSILAKR